MSNDWRQTILNAQSKVLSALKNLQARVDNKDTAKITQVYHDDGVSEGYYITNSGMDLTVSKTGTYTNGNSSVAIVEGNYMEVEDTENIITVADGDATNPRYDIVYLSKFGLALAQGTASATPSDPTLPTGALSLYRITVPAGETDGSGLTLMDLRTYLVQVDTAFNQEHNTDGTHSDITADTITEGGVLLSNKYLGKNDKAADSDKLDGLDSVNYARQTTTNITYYVNASTGSDTTGDGSSGSPFATIQHAIDQLPQIINYTVYIYVASGTYAEQIKILGFSGRGNLYIIGDETTPSNVVLSMDYLAGSNDEFNQGAVNIYGNQIFVEFSGFHIENIDNTTGNFGIWNLLNQKSRIQYCKITNFLYDGIYTHSGNTRIAHCDIYANGRHGINAASCGIVSTFSNSSTSDNGGYGLYSSAAIIMSQIDTINGTLGATSAAAGGQIFT